MGYLLFLLLASCAYNLPTGYGEVVYITAGPYKGETGRLIDDCSWFENYRVLVFSNKEYVCLRVWEMERAW